ncbi:MAG: hypothetical protein QOF32_2581 [Gammaproteobacteria bacterium]|jgi:transcriptional regulator with XRE-family HTH domain|nr:hypothetical protein [Gammaproteobacteria bacterium]
MNMNPWQIRMARAAMNWSLDRLSEVAGVHRNTISNIETGKYIGDPETLTTIKHALESVGVIFLDDDGGDSGVKLRKFQVGDIIRFRPQTKYRPSNVNAREEGRVVGVEPYPYQMGPTYRISVQFGDSQPQPYIGKYEFELVLAVENSPAEASD